MGLRSQYPARQIWSALRGLAVGQESSQRLRSLMQSHPCALVESAIAQGLGAALAVAVRIEGASIPEQLRSNDENARFARAASFDVVSRIETAFEAAGVAWVVLKGIAVAGLYQRPDLRAFNDIDILVRGADLPAAVDALEQAGMRDINRNWGNYVRYGVAEIPIWAHGIGIDLHWHVIAMARSRAGTGIDIDAMIARRRRLSVGPVEVWTLDSADLLLHVCVHAATSGGTRLLWLRDVRELIRSEPPDWDLFVARAKHTGLGARVGQLLDRARCLVDADVPETIPRSLCDPFLLNVRRWIDRNDDGAGLPERFVRGFPVIASGGTYSATIRAAAVAASNRLRREPGWDVGNPEGPLYWDSPSGGPDGRQAYMDYARSGS